MARAKEEQCKTVAFSLLSAGIFRGRQSLDTILAISVGAVADGAYEGLELCGNNQCVGCTDNSSLSHFSAMTRPSWLGRAVRNSHRHAVEQTSRRWRGGRRDDSARTRREILISTQASSASTSWPSRRPSSASSRRRRRRSSRRRRRTRSRAILLGRVCPVMCNFRFVSLFESSP